MGVDARHPEYTKWAPKWERCRDAAAGEDEVKERGETYLPRPSGQKDAEYKAYKTRAYWFNATKRTIDGLSGLIFRREPQIDAPASMTPWLDDVTLSGTSLRDFVASAVDDVVEVGRGGILVDYPSVPVERDLTIAQAEAFSARPFLVWYRAEDITNWRSGRVGARTELTMVVLHESASTPKAGDEFAEVEQDRYRVLDLDAAGSYRQRVFERRKEALSVDPWVMISETVPLARGKPMATIPFLFVGTGKTDGTVEQPPIKDLVDVNLSHYRTLADLEHGAHWTALPTPVFIGLSDEKKEVALGSTEGIVLPQGGDAKYLEFTGQGLGALEKRAEVKASEMAVLGARILAADKRQPEAAETAAIHRSGENSVLASIANTISRCVTRALEIVRDWGGLSGEISVKLNTDYLGVPMSPTMLASLTAALQAGTIAPQDYFWYLQRGEVIRPERTYEEAKADIDASPPLAAQIAEAMARNAPEPDPVAGSDESADDGQPNGRGT
jgi:hypothetical protein